MRPSRWTYPCFFTSRGFGGPWGRTLHGPRSRPPSVWGWAWGALARGYVLVLACLALACTGGGGGGGGTPTPPPPSLPVIASFTASPTTLTSGQSTVLSWSVSGATSLVLDQGIGSVAGTTSRTVSPTSTSTYTLTASNSGGNATMSTTVTVMPGAAAPTITSQPANMTVVAPGTATFAVVASGSAPLSYQWQRNGAAIAGATSATYTTPATTLADNGAPFPVGVSHPVRRVTSTPARPPSTWAPPAFPSTPSSGLARQEKAPRVVQGGIGSRPAISVGHPRGVDPPRIQHRADYLAHLPAGSSKSPFPRIASESLRWSHPVSPFSC